MKVYQSYKDVPAEAWRWQNFSPREIACKGTGQLLVDEVALDRLQALRDALGVPIVIVSAYRSPEHNRRVGGAKGSYHMKGCAFDVSMANHDPDLFEMAARSMGFRGFGYYPKSGFMHIDTGPARTWGERFARAETQVTREPEKRESVTQSTTVKTVAVDVAAKAGAGVAAVSVLDGKAQIVVAAFLGVALIASLIIFRERLRAWSAGWR